MPLLNPGDIALAVEVLNKDAKMRRAAAHDYARHPAADDLDRSVNDARSNKAAQDAAALDRVITYLSGGERHG